jgi:hypothetical protein
LHHQHPFRTFTTDAYATFMPDQLKLNFDKIVSAYLMPKSAFLVKRGRPACMDRYIIKRMFINLQ